MVITKEKMEDAALMQEANDLIDGMVNSDASVEEKQLFVFTLGVAASAGYLMTGENLTVERAREVGQQLYDLSMTVMESHAE